MGRNRYARDPESLKLPLARKLANYARVCRFDHWVKNVFMLAGTAAAVVLHRDRVPIDAELVLRTAVAFLLTSFVASTNYIVNEILDAPRDAMHPEKKHRPVPQGLVSIPLLLLMAAVLLAMGLVPAWLGFSGPMFGSLAALFVMGMAYNVRPIRTKDVPYLDVITESINNPIRLLIGWFAVGLEAWPPMSLIFCYWAIGGFLMTSKRFAEFRFIGSQRRAGAYRPSFRYYSEERLLIAMIVYISLFMFLYAILAVRYKPELLLSLPLLMIFIAWFFHLAFKPDSIVMEPERLLREPKFLLFCAVVFLLIVALGFVDLPYMQRLAQSSSL